MTARRVILGGIVGGVLIFVWGAVAHTETPLGTMGLSTLPPDKEPAVSAALKAAVPKSGVYFLPGMDLSGKASEAEQKAWLDKLAAGPHGLLVVDPAGGEAMSPRQLGVEFATDVLAALMASVLLAATRLG